MNSKENYDHDFLIALQFQYEDLENVNINFDKISSTNTSTSTNKNMNNEKKFYDFDDYYEQESSNDSNSNDKIETVDKHLLNPEWELLDPNPDIRALFIEYDKKYFYNRLGSCIVEWSKRMTICAGIFYLREGGIIRLSEPLLKYRPRIDLVQTLLHEMIHAYLYLTRNFKDRDSHGDEFKSHMNRINKLAGTNITIYHSFHDEVNNCRQHVWRCTGICRTWKPYYGYVKRSMNRAPGPNDTWWANHSSKCNGQFEKISEPEGFKTKSTKRKSDDSINESHNQSVSNTKLNKKVMLNDNSLIKIDKFFSQVNQSSQFDNKKSILETQHKSIAFPVMKSSNNKVNNNDDVVIINEIKSDYNDEILILNSSKTVTDSKINIECPVCGNKLSKSEIDIHVNNHFD